MNNTSSELKMADNGRNNRENGNNSNEGVGQEEEGSWWRTIAKGVAVVAAAATVGTGIYLYTRGDDPQATTEGRASGIPHQDSTPSRGTISDRPSDVLLSSVDPQGPLRTSRR